MKGIVCPISTEKIDSNVSRVTVFINVILMLFFIFTRNPFFIGIVVVDYFIRAALKVEYSPIRFISICVTSLFKLSEKPIGLAQKVFASRLGFLFSLVSLVLFLTGFQFAAIIIAGLLMILSALDSIFNFCVGCLIYNYLVYPFFKG